MMKREIRNMGRMWQGSVTRYDVIEEKSIIGRIYSKCLSEDSILLADIAERFEQIRDEDHEWDIKRRIQVFRYDDPFYENVIYTKLYETS